MDDNQPGDSSSSHNSVRLITPPPTGQNDGNSEVATISTTAAMDAAIAAAVEAEAVEAVEAEAAAAAAADIENPTGIGNPLCVRNMRDILNYTTQMSVLSADNEEIIDLTNADEVANKNEFFKNMLSTLSVNVQEELNNSINILLDTNKYIAEYEHAFSVIEEYIENIDYANDFQKLGGFQVFIPGLKSPEPSVRTKTANLIVLLTQNNPYCQEKFIEHPTYIHLLMDMVLHDVEVEVRTKALFAISCLIRQDSSIFWKFVDLGGIDLIVNALKSSTNKIQIKAMFLIYSTCHMGNDIADVYIEHGVVEIICSVIKKIEKSFDRFHHDLFLSTLVQFVRLSPSKVKPICSSVEDLKVSLLSLSDSYPLDDTCYQDEKDQIIWLMQSLTL